MSESTGFHVIEDEDSGGFVVVPATGRTVPGQVVARVDKESTGWLVAAALPAALLRDEPSVLQAGDAEHAFWLRDESVSGVELESLGVHMLRDPLETLVSVTRTPETLAGLLRSASPEVLEQALSRLQQPEA